MDASGTLVEVLKGEGPRVLATLARTVGDLAVAEDALSEATITALDAWPETGIPDNPRGWLGRIRSRPTSPRPTPPRPAGRRLAVTERDGPEAGLAALKTIAGLEHSHLWHAALADNLRRLGRPSEAAGELHTAVTLAPSEAEQRLLQGRLRKVRSELG
jgi:predicted RNA polymerase sigma factor